METAGMRNFEFELVRQLRTLHLTCRHVMSAETANAILTT